MSNNKNGSMPIIFTTSGFTFELNEKALSAFLIGENSDNDSLIPDTIKYENKIYKVNLVQNSSFMSKLNLKTMKKCHFSSIGLRFIIFPVNLETLDFIFHPNIESINFPAKLKYVNQEIFSHCSKLKQIIISPNNQHFCYIDEENKLIGKKSVQNTVSTLIFACRDIQYAKIPSEIIKIESNSFKNCRELCSIEFENESQLKTIDENAFSNCRFKEFIFPSSIKNIDKNAFSECKFLKAIEFEENCRIRSINLDAFEKMQIQNILMPKSCFGISNQLFDKCTYIISIEFLSDDLYFGLGTFNTNHNLSLISCPNVKQIYIADQNLSFFRKDFRIYLPKDTLFL